MNCFEWQTHASDYLDGTLPDKFVKKADLHLKKCPACTGRIEQYRKVVETIGNLPKISAPAALKKAPLSAVISRWEAARVTLSHWEGIPWYFRTLLESSGIVLVILVGIASAPRIRTLYEKKIEKNLTDFKESLTVADSKGDGIDPIQTPLPDPSLAQAHPVPVVDEVAGEDEDREPENQVHVGRAQLWRFTLKTVSPDELRPQVIAALTDLGVPDGTPGLAGIQVPGGIEFDLVLPQTTVPQVKNTLEKMAPKPTERAGGAPGLDNFSWYRVKSRRKLPEGKSQVVIWLSQPG